MTGSRLHMMIGHESQQPVIGMPAVEEVVLAKITMQLQMGLTPTALVAQVNIRTKS